MKYIWSDSLEEMVLASFSYKGKVYEWNDRDCVYYNVDTDENWFSEVPNEVVWK